MCAKYDILVIKKEDKSIKHLTHIRLALLSSLGGLKSYPNSANEIFFDIYMRRRYPKTPHSPNLENLCMY
jgi:hypothetical protein